MAVEMATPNVMDLMNELIQSKLDQLIQEHSGNQDTMVEALQSCRLSSTEINQILKMNSRPRENKITRPQSGYFLYLNANRASITDTINAERKAEWMKENDINSIKDNESPWALQGKDKVTLVTKRAGTEWKERMSQEDKEPYLEQAKVLKQEYELKKQNLGSVVQESGPPPVKRGRGRPKGSKNKKNSTSSTPPSSPKPIEAKIPEDNEDEEIVKVSKFNYEGKDYLLDSASGDVYDIKTQDEVGRYDGSKIIFN